MPTRRVKKKPAARKAAAAPTPKVSPLAGASIEAFIKQRLEGWQAELTRQLVALIHAAAPAASAAVKWGQPVFESNGPFAFIKPAKEHVTFGFWRGAELADPHSVLQGEGERMKHVKLTGLDYDAAQLRAFVKQAVELNRERGNPTQR